MESRHDVLHREPSIVDRSEKQREGGFESGKAGRRRIGLLFADGVGSMVRGKAVDDFEVLPEGIPIGGGCQSRPNLSATPEMRGIGVVEKQMMRGHLTRDSLPTVAGITHQDDLVLAG